MKNILLSKDIVKAIFMLITFASMTAIVLSYETLFGVIGICGTILMFFIHMIIFMALFAQQEED